MASDRNGQEVTGRLHALLLTDEQLDLVLTAVQELGLDQIVPTAAELIEKLERSRARPN